jgi:hypothetical protein
MENYSKAQIEAAFDEAIAQLVHPFKAAFFAALGHEVPQISSSSESEEIEEESSSEDSDRPLDVIFPGDDDSFVVQDDDSLEEIPPPLQRKDVPVLGKRISRPARRFEPEETNAAEDREADRRGVSLGAGRASRATRVDLIDALQVYQKKGKAAFYRHPWTKSQFAEAFEVIQAGWGSDANKIKITTVMNIMIQKCRANGAPPNLIRENIDGPAPYAICVFCQGKHPCAYDVPGLRGKAGRKCATLCLRILDLAVCFAQLASQKIDPSDSRWIQGAWEEIHACQEAILDAHADKGGNVKRLKK